MKNSNYVNFVQTFETSIPKTSPDCQLLSLLAIEFTGSLRRLIILVHPTTQCSETNGAKYC